MRKVFITVAVIYIGSVVSTWPESCDSAMVVVVLKEPERARGDQKFKFKSSTGF